MLIWWLAFFLRPSLYVQMRFVHLVQQARQQWVPLHNMAASSCSMVATHVSQSCGRCQRRHGTGSARVVEVNGLQLAHWRVVTQRHDQEWSTKSVEENQSQVLSVAHSGQEDEARQEDHSCQAPHWGTDSRAKGRGPLDRGEQSSKRHWALEWYLLRHWPWFSHVVSFGLNSCGMGCHSRCMITSGRIPDCMRTHDRMTITIKTQCVHDDVCCDDSMFRSVIIVM